MEYKSLRHFITEYAAEHYDHETQNGQAYLAWVLDDPDKDGSSFEGFRYKFDGGDYELDDREFRSIEIMGKFIENAASENGIDLTQFPEVKTAMGYDNNADNLSYAELGALSLALGLSIGTEIRGGLKVDRNQFTDQYQTDHNPKSPSIDILGFPDNEDGNPFSLQDTFAEKAGAHIFGDSKPELSSQTTNTPEADEALLDAAVKNNSILSFR